MDREVVRLNQGDALTAAQSERVLIATAHLAAMRDLVQRGLDPDDYLFEIEISHGPESREPSRTVLRGQVPEKGWQTCSRCRLPVVQGPSQSWHVDRQGEPISPRCDRAMQTWLEQLEASARAIPKSWTARANPPDLRF